MATEETPECQVSPQEDIDFRVVELLDVSVSLPNSHGEVQLSESDSPYRVLSFPIGLQEAVALAHAKDQSLGPRPGSHELFTEVLQRTHIDVIALRITDLIEGTYVAELDLMSPRGREVVACRPSDGLILCLRQKVPAPILVNKTLMGDD